MTILSYNNLKHSRDSQEKADRTTMPKSTIILYGLLILGVALNLLVNLIPTNLQNKLLIIVIYTAFAYFITISMLVKRYGIANFMTIFIILSIPFSYGQHLVAVFNPAYLLCEQNYSILDGRLNDTSIVNASFFVMNFLLLIVVGYICVNGLTKNKILATPVRQSKSVLYHQIFLFVAIMLLIISIIPAFKEILGKYDLSKSYSYIERRNLEDNSDYLQMLGVSTLDIYIAYWFRPAIYMLLIGIKNRKIRLIPYAILIAYSILYLLTGSRFEMLKVIFAIFMIEYIWKDKKLSGKQLLQIAVIALALMISFSAIGNIRGGLTGTISVSDALTDVVDSSPISSTLWESGITFTTISNVFDKCPSQVPFFLGKSYIGSILLCMPDFLRFGFLEKYTLKVSSTFSPLYYGTTYFGYGSSIYAEQYYNLGYFSLIIAVILGLSFGMFERKLLLSKFNNNPSQFLLYMVLCSELIYSVRNDLYAIPRTLIITVVIPIVIIRIIYMIVRGRGTDKK